MNPPDKRSWLARFVAAYGWRAYALPVLIVVTLAAIGNMAGGESEQPKTKNDKPAAAAGDARATTSPKTSPSSGPSPSTKPSQRPSQATTPQPSQDEQIDQSKLSQKQRMALPPGPHYPERGDATYSVVPGTSKVIGEGTLYRYVVEVENGMDFDRNAFADEVQRILSDRRSWTAGDVALQRVDVGDADFRVTLTSSLTIRDECGYTLKAETSCYSSLNSRTFINVARWVRGAIAFGDDLETYRRYVVNHEVGHALGYHHMSCPKDGSLAPLMMEQTLGTFTEGVGSCKPNGWPYVDGKLLTGPYTQGY